MYRRLFSGIYDYGVYKNLRVDMISINPKHTR
nr:MAG TPA: hypothetical protein [Caudoviricetes sp.]